MNPDTGTATARRIAGDLRAEAERLGEVRLSAATARQIADLLVGFAGEGTAHEATGAPDAGDPAEGRT